jgi:hypothetical protein
MMMTIQNRADANNITKSGMTKSGMTGKAARSKHHYCRQVLMAESKACLKENFVLKKIL